MDILTDDIIHFFHKQGFIIISTMDGNRCPHSACKGMVHMSPDGIVYLLDLYRGETCQNLKANPHISLTAVDEHKFVGYCLKGAAKVVPEERIEPHIKKAWDERITSRLTKRVLKEIRDEVGHPNYPEVLLPKPEYMIIVQVEEVVNLAPHSIR